MKSPSVLLPGINHMNGLNNRNGLPIGQIVLPDRDKGRNLKSTSLAIRPGHRELFIVANSGTEPGGAMIFRSGAFAPAPFPFSHQ
ncbi:unnamed protein product [Klebsiella pneumoniae]|uniref:Gluconolactonase n=1 Tax=Klebsiella pneumoniae TaxID=573 RepID=A0A060VHZ4_KLEPN|nr:unnamed protein product [Klebsiella pneumoniae]STW39328.1 gluconolactonase [Klebsiella pneumoniae]